MRYVRPPGPAVCGVAILVLAAIVNGIAHLRWLDILAWHFSESSVGLTRAFFAALDPWWMSLACTLVAASMLWRPREREPVREFEVLAGTRLLYVMFALLVVGVTASAVVHDAHPLSADEYAIRWQTQLFRHGQMLAYIDPHLAEYARWMTIHIHPLVDDPSIQMSGYLPSFALIMLPFEVLGIPWLVNPLLTLVGACLLVAIMRQALPGSRSAACIALIAYVTSSQILIVAGSGYSLAAHLTGNLLWLLLYLRWQQRGDRVAFMLLPVVGVVVLLLHKPFHAIFVLPFMVRIARTATWRQILWVAAVYAAGFCFMHVWNGLRGAEYERDVADLVSNGLRMEGMLSAIQFVTWQPVAVFLAIGVLARWKEAPPFIRDLTFGILLAIVLACLRQEGQAHGWGSRYCHMVLGGLCVVAGWTWGAPGATRAFLPRGWLVFACGVSMVLIIWRMAMVETIVRPFADTRRWLGCLPAAAVIIDAPQTWLAHDLARNDPELMNRPLLVMGGGLPVEAVARLHGLGPVVRVTDAHLRALGMRSKAAIMSADWSIPTERCRDPDQVPAPDPVP